MGEPHNRYPTEIHEYLQQSQHAGGMLPAILVDREGELLKEAADCIVYSLVHTGFKELHKEYPVRSSGADDGGSAQVQRLIDDCEANGFSQWKDHPGWVKKLLQHAAKVSGSTAQDADARAGGGSGNKETGFTTEALAGVLSRHYIELLVLAQHILIAACSISCCLLVAMQPTLKDNFLTAETARDIIISCNAVILLVKFFRLCQEEGLHVEWDNTRLSSKFCEYLFQFLRSRQQGTKITAHTAVQVRCSGNRSMKTKGECYIKCVIACRVCTSMMLRWLWRWTVA